MTFGRRASSPKPQRTQAHAIARPAPGEKPAMPALSLEIEPSPDIDAELREWKAQRSFQIPWRQLSLMASVCFGLASFVLPDSVNANVDYALYGLSAMSLYVWLSGKFKKNA
jgi:hypothetical protein